MDDRRSGVKAEGPQRDKRATREFTGGVRSPLAIARRRTGSHGLIARREREHDEEKIAEIEKDGAWRGCPPLLLAARLKACIFLSFQKYALP